MSNFSWRWAEYTVWNIETTPVLFRANTHSEEILPASFLLITNSYLIHKLFVNNCLLQLRVEFLSPTDSRSMVLRNRGGDSLYSSGFNINVPTNEIAFRDFDQLQRQAYFWSLPPKFRGDQVTIIEGKQIISSCTWSGWSHYLSLFVRYSLNLRISIIVFCVLFEWVYVLFYPCNILGWMEWCIYVFFS